MRTHSAPDDQAALRQAALERIKDGITPLEPRILLDAALDLDPGGAGLAMFQAVIGALDAQAKELEDLFDVFETELGQGLGVAGTLIDPDGDGPESGAAGAARAAAALMAEVRQSIGAATAVFEARIDAFVQAEAAGLAAAINTSLDNELGIAGFLDASDLQSLLTFANLADVDGFDVAVADRLEDRLDSALGGAAPGDLATLQATIATAVADRADDVRATLFSITLEDVVGDQGLPIIAFADVLGENRVGVTVTPLPLALGLSEAFGIDIFSADGGSVAFDDFGFSFEIAAGYDAPSQTSTIAFENFDFTGFTFGGEVFTGDPGNPLSVELGLLSATLDGIETALFQVGISGFDALELRASFDFATLTAATDFTVAPTGVTLSVQPIGEDAFVLVAEDDVYSLLSVALGGRIGFVDKTGPLDAGDFDPAARTSRDYALTISLDSLLASADADFGAAFREAVAIAIDVDLSAMGLGAEEEEAFAAVIASVATIGGAEIRDMLASLADDFTQLFRAKAFDFSLPFTDLKMRDAFNAIPGLMTGIVEAFELDLAALGLAGIGALSPDVTERTGRAVDLGRFAGVASFSLAMPGAYGDILITVVSPNGGGGFADVAQLAAALNAGIASATLEGEPLDEPLNVEVVAAGGALTFRMLDDAGPGVGIGLPDPDEVDDFLEAALSGLGFPTGVALQQAVTAFDFGTLDLGQLKGAEGLRFTLIEDGRERRLDIASTQITGGFASVAELAGLLNARLDGSNLEARVNDAGDGIALALVDPDGPAAALTIKAADAVMASSLNGLLTWVSAKLDDVIEGAGLALDADGRLQFLLPSMGGVINVADANLSMEALGFDLVGGLDLRASLSASIEARLDTTLVFDLKGYAGAFTGGAAASLAERARAVLEDDREVSILDHVLLSDSRIFARIAASATDIEGSAGLGIVGAVFGETDPGQNALALDVQLLATLVGLADGDFVNEATLAQIAAAVTAGRPESLLGRFDLVGGLLTDADGVPLLDGNALRQEADIFAAPPGEGEVATFAVVRLGDVRIQAAGLNGLAADAIDGLSIAVPDLFDPDSFLVVVDSPFADALTGMRSGDLLDSLASLATLLQAVGDSLATDLPFLGAEIPVLNLSLLDVVDVSSRFLGGLQAFRNEPNVMLGDLERQLDKVFGQGATTLAWDAESSILEFALAIPIVDKVYGTPFSIDLAALLGDQLATILGPTVAEFVSGLVDARGDGELMVAPNLALGLAFGIDLSGVLAQPSTLASGETALGMLASVATVTAATQAGRSELRIARVDRTTGDRQSVDLVVSGAETVDDLVALVGDAIGGAFAATSFAFDEATGRFVFTDSEATARDRSAGVDALFGAAAGDAVDEDGVLVVLGTSNVAGLDAAAAYSFDVLINDLGVTVEIPAEAGRDDLLGAVQTALSAASLSRLALSDKAMPGATVALGQLVRASLDGNALRLEATNFAEANGYAPITLAVAGKDVSHEILFSVTERNGSNAARLMGFASGELMAADRAFSAELFEAAADEGVRIFLDTEKTELIFELEAGIAEGLNVVLGFGPIEVNVVGGHALLNAGDGSGDPASIRIGFHDIDGDANEGQFDLAHLATLASDPDRSFLELFALDVRAGLDVALPMSDTLGLFDPAEDGFYFNTSLINTLDGSSLADFDMADVRSFFDGALIDFTVDGAFALDDIQVNFPDLTEFFSNINVLAIINDPRMMLRGLDSIIQATDRSIGSFLRSVDLPIIGSNLGTGITVFQDMRFDIIEPALAVASTPKEDGSLPTTVDLLTGFVNDQFNALFDTSGVTYLQAFLDTSGGMDASYLYGALSFSGELFSASLDLGFEFGIPGLELDLKEGSAIDLSVGYDINIGFGIDKGGFFLLNDTDEAEISIDFLVDAGQFQGSFSVANLLRVSAYAVESPLGLPANSFVAIPNYAAGESGDVYLRASLEVDLYGEQGDDETRDLSGIAVKKFAGTGQEIDVTFNKSVRVSQLRLADLVEVSLVAEAEVNLQLVGEVLNPKTGEPIKVNGAEAIPKVITELVIQASFDASRAEMFSVDEMLFNQLRLDASQLYQSFIAPIIEPIRPIIDPISGFLDILNVTPINFVLDAISAAFPIIRLPITIAQIANDAASFAQALDATGGVIVFGTFDFGSTAEDLVSGQASSANLSMDDFSVSVGGSTTIGSFGSSNGGLLIKMPIVDDPKNALNLILGKFDQVSLVEAQFSLINLDFQFNLVSDLISSIGGPKAFANALASVLTARLEARAFMGFTVGYDLAGVAGFVQTMDPTRLVDGIYIDSSDGGLLDLYLGAFLQAKINLGIVSGGVRGGGEVYFRLGLNDPNNDGKLRIPEMVAIAKYLDEINADFGTFLGTVFKGSTGFRLFAEAFASINLLFTKINFDVTIFDINQNYDFGGLPIGPTMVADLAETGGSAVLNVGARAGENMTKAATSGNERITISGPSSPFQLQYANGNVTQSATIDENANAIIIPAGDGNNVIDLRGITTEVPTLTFTGKDNDEIYLPKQGFHIVFAGGGDDVIKVEAGATGTYWIFGGKGSDEIEILGGDAMVFAADDYGLYDRFVAEFANGSFSRAAAEAILAAPWGDQQKTLSQFKTTYTQTTQTTADRASDTIKLGAGDHLVFAGGGDDVIETDAGSGTVEIYGGDGDDEIRARGAEVYVEGGGGADLIILGNGTNEVYGWGKALGETGATADDGLSALANQDGNDVIIGGSGQDFLYGQRGDNILMGGMGDDVVHGGRGNDIITGGVFEFTHRGGANDGQAIEVASLWAGLPGAVTIETANVADGDDTLFSGGGRNVVFGGGGADELTGGSGSNLLIGDFGAVEMSANRTIERFESRLVDSANAGPDVITGGVGNDILIGGGAAGGLVEYLTAMQGSNIVIGDTAEVDGARIMEAVTRITSLHGAMGNPDVIRTGSGHDIIVGGEDEDDIESEGGANIVAGDLAELDLTTGRFAAITSPAAGDDRIVVGDGGDDAPGGFHPINLIIGGAGGDVIEVGRGDDAIIGDDGEILFDTVARETLITYVALPDGEDDPAEIAADAAKRATIAGMVHRLSSTGAASDGDDQVTATGGDNRVVLGGGDDTASLGDGRNKVLGDSGVIDRQAGTLAGVSDAFAGDDDITVGGGDNLIIAGSRDDKITVGGGANLVLGDTGEIIHDTTTFAPIRLTSAHDARDGADTMTAGDGDNWIILGGAGDVATLGDGRNVVLGDSGVLDPIDGSMTSASDQHAGDDSIVAGDGDNLVIGGSRHDGITVGQGDNLVLGDTGEILFDPITFAPIRLTSEHDARDGADTLTAGDGDNWIILGGAGDVATLGDGRNVVLGDSGDLDPIAGSMTSSSDQHAGDDSIVAGDGDNLVIGGSRHDGITLGQGNNLILGDTGEILFDPATFAPLRLTSAHDARDGNDWVMAGDGRNFAILGGGGDTGHFGSGGNRVIGDSGVILPADADDPGRGRMWSTEANLGSGDLITTGAGDDFVIGGQGGDTILSSGGDNAIIGDSGTILHDAELDANRPLRLSSLIPWHGGNDTITTGTGHDIIVGGQGRDTITTAGGDNIVIGDWATVATPLFGGGVGRITSTDPEHFGNDVITTGPGNDIVIGGGGSDMIQVGAGHDTALGDYGDITYVNRTDIETLELTEHRTHGNDTLGATGLGDNLLVGQGGRDLITGGLGDDILIGDLSLFGFLPTGVFGQGESHVDRIVYLEYIHPKLGFDDTIYGTAGRNLILGGFGDDRLTGGTGQDVIFGDSFLMDRYYTVRDGAMVREEIIIRSNFAFTPGGFDRLDGGGGNNIMVGHLGPDLFIGNTENDFLAGDTIWLRLQGGFGDDDFTTSRFLNVIQVNFPGFGAPDVVSGAQVNAAVGAPLDSQSRAAELAVLRERLNHGGLMPDTAMPSSALSEFMGDRAQSLFARLVNAMHDPELLTRIVDGLSFDLDLELLLELVRADLMASLDDPTSAEISALDRYLMLRLFDEIIRPAIEALHEGEAAAEVADEQAAEAAADDDDEAGDVPVTQNRSNEGIIPNVL